PNSASILGQPDLAPILSINFVLKSLDQPLRLDQALKLSPAIGIHIYDAADVANAGHEFFGRSIAVYTSQRRIHADIAPLRGSLKNTFDGILKNAAIFLLRFSAFAHSGIQEKQS